MFRAVATKLGGAYRSLVTVLRGSITAIRELWWVDHAAAAYVLAALLLYAVTPIALFGVAAESVGAVDSGGDPKWLLLIALSLLFLLEASTEVLQHAGLRAKAGMDTRLRERLLDAVYLPSLPGDDQESSAEREVIAVARQLSPLGFTPGDAARDASRVLASRLEPVIAIAVVLFLVPRVGLILLITWATGQLVLMAASQELVNASMAAVSSPDLAYLRGLSTSRGAAREVRVFRLAPFLVRRYTEGSQKVLHEAFKQHAPVYRQYALGGVVFAIGMIATLVVTASQYADGQLGLVATVLVFLLAVRILGDPDMSADISVLYGTNAVPAIRNEIQRLRELADRDKLSQHDDLRGVSIESIEFRGVSYRYSGADSPAVENVSFKISGGDRVAIVGANGSGKSTILKLLLGLLRPSSGSILVNGHDLEQCDPKEWYRHCAAVFQDYLRFELTVLQNIDLNHLEGQPPSDAHLSAAGVAQVLSRIQGLSNGWHTRINSGGDRGVQLSGGEWQRIALTRALYSIHEGAQVLVLDEPTASLDVDSEIAVCSALLSDAGLAFLDRPTIRVLVSHRLAAVKDCDCVIVLDGGRLTEQGSPRDLIAAGGMYARMFRAQARQFLGDVR